MSIEMMQKRSSWAVSPYLLLGAAVVISLFAFGEGLLELVDRWMTQEEYSHGFFIPLISIGFLWMRREALVQSIGRPNWFGLVIVLGAISMLIIGNLSAIYILAQLGFIVALAGIALTYGGFSFLRITLMPLSFLLFAIPLPFFIDAAISWRLQLISSELGVFFVRVMNIPVFLEGNVIDLGEYKLLVTEACSGLRYLYPLLSLGFLTAYSFKAPMWQRVFVFLSTIPITILMNSLRIGMIGVLVNYWGIGMAEGFIHVFQGWIIFIACGLLLMGEMYIMAKLTTGKGFFESLQLPDVKAIKPSKKPELSLGGKPIFLATISLALASVLVYSITNRDEIIPDRQRFVSFPKTLGDWKGRTTFLKPRIELFLGLDDYLMANYTVPEAPKKPLINLYMAYYKSQRSGVSPHSPQACIPGGGWLITDIAQKRFVLNANETPVIYNRVIIQKKDIKQIVYYWFDQRGRKFASEFDAKWYLLKDALLMNRTDGTMLRLVTVVKQDEEEADADKRLTGFMSKMLPEIKGYIPGAPVGSEV